MREAALGVLSDRVDAQLREYGDKAEQSTAHRRGRVNVRLGQALDLHAAVVQFRDRLDRHDLAAGDAVKLADHERVAGTEVVEAGKPLGAICDPAGLAPISKD